MELIDAIADTDDPMDRLRRIEATAPPGSTFLTVTMPPFKTYRDRQVVAGLKELGWRVMASVGRQVFLQRMPTDIPDQLRFNGSSL